MIQALSDINKKDWKRVNRCLATVTDSNVSKEAEVERSDEQTIREQSVDTSQPARGLQSIITLEGSRDTQTDGSIELHQDIQLDRASTSNSPYQLPLPVIGQRQHHGPAKTTTQADRSLPQTPVPFRLQSSSTLTSQ